MEGSSFGKKAFTRKGMTWSAQVAILIACLSAPPEAMAQERELPKISKFIKVDKIVQTDVELIQMMATIGAQEKVKFNAGADVLAFISAKCGAPSAILPVHPTYLRLFLDLNGSAKGLNLSSLPAPLEETFPGCIPFARLAPPSPALDAAQFFKALGAPFDAETFDGIKNDAGKAAALRSLGSRAIGLELLSEAETTS